MYDIFPTKHFTMATNIAVLLAIIRWENISSIGVWETQLSYNFVNNVIQKKMTCKNLKVHFFLILILFMIQLLTDFY